MLQFKIPSPVTTLMSRLEQAGFATYLVGGCLRDSLLGNVPTDWDLATAALPQQVQALFSDARVIETGLQHGTVTVILDGVQMEVTTFRKDGTYADHRRPEQVSFTGHITEDLARRDFTVNAMAYSPARGLSDPFGGQCDLQNKILRAVGDPIRRFEEDALRILRLVRFSATLGFAVEEETAAAAIKQASLLKYIAQERILQELEKLLMGEFAVTALRQFTPVIIQVLPELTASVGFDQNNYIHCTPWSIAPLIVWRAGRCCCTIAGSPTVTLWTSVATVISTAMRPSARNCRKQRWSACGWTNAAGKRSWI